MCNESIKAASKITVLSFLLKIQMFSVIYKVYFFGEKKQLKFQERFQNEVVLKEYEKMQ